MEFTFTFIRIFLWGVYLVSPVLIMMCLLITILGIIVGRIESWSKFDSIYWAYITALTIGYGDIRPTKRTSKILSIVLGAIGIMLGGLVVAITVEATTNAFKMHIDPELIDVIKHKVK